MSRIRILSDHLANQIAAGEVVERPASVVKELLENSLDAAADRISVQVEGGGTRLLRVIDNGMGMDEDDVLLSLERHATSKLREEQQLGAIATMGFRGEAIPSIASVSRFTILSRPADRETGTRAEVRYGTLHAVHEDGCARGTIVEVGNLFGNIPARKKFLKTNRTELYHIEEVVRNQALACPEVAFSLQVDGRPVLSYPAAPNLEARMRAVFRYQGTLLELEAVEEQEGTAVLSGFLQLPESISASTARLRLLVNKRPIQDRMLRHAVIEGLQGFLMKGHSPAGVIMLELSPEEIDVNVHPAKREIRFRRSREVHRFVTAGVRRAVQDYQERMRKTLFTAPDPADPSNSSPVSHPDPPAITPQNMPFPESALISSGVGPPLPEPTERIESREPESRPVVTGQEEEQPVQEKYPAEEQLRGITLIGQLLNLYLLCEKDGKLLVIDQHAAHERILYGRLRQAYLEKTVPAQSLLFPVTMELGPDHWELFEKNYEELPRLGLQAEPFGDSVCMVRATPAFLGTLSPADILVETLKALEGTTLEDGGGVPAAVDSLFSSMACKAAIRGGDALKPREMIELLVQMESSEVFSHCPHGRPVVKSFSRSEIEHWFHRT